MDVRLGGPGCPRGRGADCRKNAIVLVALGTPVALGTRLPGCTRRLPGSRGLGTRRPKAQLPWSSRGRGHHGTHVPRCVLMSTFRATCPPADSVAGRWRQGGDMFYGAGSGTGVSSTISLSEMAWGRGQLALQERKRVLDDPGLGQVGDTLDAILGSSGDALCLAGPWLRPTPISPASRPFRDVPCQVTARLLGHSESMSVLGKIPGWGPQVNRPGGRLSYQSLGFSIRKWRRPLMDTEPP